jgi:hypothetical protein
MVERMEDIFKEKYLLGNEKYIKTEEKSLFFEKIYMGE